MTKSEVIIFGHYQVDIDIKALLGTWTTNVWSLLRNLGVIFDAALTFKRKMVKSFFIS